MKRIFKILMLLIIVIIAGCGVFTNEQTNNITIEKATGLAWYWWLIFGIVIYIIGSLGLSKIWAFVKEITW
jgi:uncharacterized BrkB/YihY/UPF0761 family membrane protein